MYAAKILISFLPFVFAAGPLLSAQPFKPWGSSVTVADENIVLHVHKSPAPQKKTPDAEFQRKGPVVKVFNGVQGGAFFLIKFFQAAISPQDGPSCRFSPTCSAYGRDAVIKHGALLGSFMAGERLIRCNPYNRPGVDNVPDSLSGH